MRTSDALVTRLLLDPYLSMAAAFVTATVLAAVIGEVAFHDVCTPILAEAEASLPDAFPPERRVCPSAR